MFIVEFFIIAQNSKQPKCWSADEWINKIWFTHTMEFYSAIKRTQVLIHADMEESQKCMLNERSQMEKTTTV